MSRRAEEVSDELLAELGDLARNRQPGPAGEATASFLAAYFASAAPEDVTGTTAIDLYGMALAHRDLATRRAPDEVAIRVLAPRFDVHGWSSRHTVVQVATDDMPFIVDSVRMAISARGHGIHVLHHPVIDGVSLVHVEVDRSAADDGEALTDSLRSSLADVRAAVADWQAMLADLRASTATLASEGAGAVLDADLDEAVKFLEWLADDNFTFLGARSYELIDEGGEARVRAVRGSGLGILRAHEAGDEPLAPTPNSPPPPCVWRASPCRSP